MISEPVINVDTGPEDSHEAAGRLIVAVALIMAVAAVISQIGTWVYSLGDNSQGVRILGDVLVGVGPVTYLLLLVWTLMSFWFWPNGYKLEPVKPEGEPTETSAPKRYPDVRGHSVKLRRARP